jgi:hypothetical protein
MDSTSIRSKNDTGPFSPFVNALVVNNSKQNFERYETVSTGLAWIFALKHSFIGKTQSFSSHSQIDS